MDSRIPEPVNQKRRADLTRYTVLAILVYHVPIAAGFMALVLGLAQYSYKELTYAYLGLFPSNIIVLILIRTQSQITRPYIQTMMFIQIVVCVFFMAAIFHIMEDLRYLGLLSSLLPLIFVFTQAELWVSFSLIAVYTIVYLAVSYTSYRFSGQNDRFGEDCLAVLTFLTTSSFVAFMCGILQKQRREIKASRDKIQSTFRELESSHTELEQYHSRMMDNLHYAEMIQRSLLPGLERLKTELPESLIIWLPKDIVGGDIFYTYTTKDTTIIALMDCTGHGISGAFITLIAYTEIRKIILDQQCFDPPDILSRLNIAVKNVLHKNSNRKTEDGLDAAIIHVDHVSCTLRYSGAQIPLFYVDAGQVIEIKSDRQSIGYADSKDGNAFTLNTVQLSRDNCVYLTTDGLTNQEGGDKNTRFGTATFKGLISRLYPLPFSIQRQEILRRFNEYKNGNEQLDDVTVIGFRI